MCGEEWIFIAMDYCHMLGGYKWCELMLSMRDWKRVLVVEQLLI